MNGGINQLVNTYKGNPQPLAQKVQNAQQQVQQQTQQQLQQGQPPGAIPPDLEEAIALQRISELRQGAQAQQAMQAGGAQPSVVEKLRQMLGNMQQQGQPQMGQMPQQMPQQTVMAAHGGSIDQLISNLGRHYAGGGIVAFSKPTAENNYSRVTDPNAEENTSSQFVQDIAKIPQAFDDMKARAREEDRIQREQDARMAKYQQDKLAAQQNTSFFNYLFGTPSREKEGLAKLTELSNAPVSKVAQVDTTKSNQAEREDAAAVDSAQAAAAAAAANQKKRNVVAQNAPRINTAVPGSSDTAKPVIPAKPAVEAMSPLEKVIQDSIMKTMGQDPDEVRRKAIEANTKAMGLDALLKPAQDRVAAREAMIKQIQEDRTPEWVKGLQRAGRANPRSGVGGLLGELGAGATEARESYSAENLRFLDELNKLNSDIDKAKIEGRYKDVAAGETAIKDLISSQRQAETSGTSLLNTTAINKTREQTAKDALAGRMQSAAQHNAQIALGREEKTDAGYREQAMKLAIAAATKEKQLPANMVKYKDTSTEQLAASMYDRIYNALKSGKMGAAPSAESPSGTPPDVQALLNKYGGK